MCQMIRKTITTLLFVIATVFTLATMAEAAPKKTVHHRARHSSRVSSGSTATTKKKTVRHRANGSVSKSTSKRTTKKTPSTKPH
jgi:hypothetical protein